VPIKASSAQQIEGLIAQLSSESASRRDAAVARLTLFGARAVPRLVQLLESNPPREETIAALHALEAVADRRAVDSVLHSIERPESEVAAAAARAAAALTGGPDGARVVDRLTATALDGSRAERVRLAAVRTLRTLKRSTIAPLLKALAKDPSEAIRREASGSSPTDPLTVVLSAADGDLPESAAELGSAVDEAGAQASLAALLGAGVGWTRARGRVHLELARRGSRIALYDLREAFEEARAPLPDDFLAALSKIGDESCLESLATAFAHTTDRRWRPYLAEAFGSIVKREKLTHRSVVAKRIAKRWPGPFDALWPGKAGRSSQRAANTPLRTRPR
jgi:HEAT repeat protein